MKLYFVRHGLAGQSGDYLNDRERPLTEEGRAKTAKVAQISVKKAGIIGLEVPNQENPLGKCQLFWLTAPKLLL